jgi:hypothetical protein
MDELPAADPGVDDQPPLLWGPFDAAAAPPAGEDAEAGTDALVSELPPLQSGLATDVGLTVALVLAAYPPPVSSASKLGILPSYAACGWP